MYHVICYNYHCNGHITAQCHDDACYDYIRPKIRQVWVPKRNNKEVPKQLWVPKKILIAFVGKELKIINLVLGQWIFKVYDREQSSSCKLQRE